MDQRHRVIEYVELFRGTIDGASVFPREVVKLALEKGAAACVLLHNHPSGVKDQSHADEIITKRVAAAPGVDRCTCAGPPNFCGRQRPQFCRVGTSLKC